MDDELIQKVRDLLGEHFHNWVFAVEDLEGEFFYDYSTPLVGEALMRNALKDFDTPDFPIDWGDEWDEDEDGEGWKTL